MRLALVLGVLALAGCDRQPAADGYRWGAATWDRRAPAVEIVTHKSLAELRKAAPAAARTAHRDLMAWARISRDGRCQIHVVDPAVSYGPEWLGHELAHCAWGEWHR